MYFVCRHPGFKGLPSTSPLYWVRLLRQRPGRRAGAATAAAGGGENSTRPSQEGFSPDTNFCIYDWLSVAVYLDQSFEFLKENSHVGQSGVNAHDLQLQVSITCGRGKRCSSCPSPAPLALVVSRLYSLLSASNNTCRTMHKFGVPPPPLSSSYRFSWLSRVFPSCHWSPSNSQLTVFSPLLAGRVG